MTSPRTTLVAGCLALALSFAPSPALGHDVPPTNALTVNVLDVLNGIVNFEIEHAMNARVSLHGGLDFLFFEGISSDRAPDSSIFGMGPTFGFRLYLVGDAPAGLFLGPFAGIAYVTAEQDGSRREALGYQVGGLAGVNFLLLGPIEVGLGIGAAWHSLAVDVGDETVGIRGWAPRFRLALGFAF